MDKEEGMMNIWLAQGQMSLLEVPVVPSQEDGNKKTHIQRWTGIGHLLWVKVGLELSTVSSLREFINIEDEEEVSFQVQWVWKGSNIQI